MPNFNTTAPLCKSNSGDPRNFNILSHHSYNHFPFYSWGGVIGQFSLVFALPLGSGVQYKLFKNHGLLLLRFWVPNLQRFKCHHKRDNTCHNWKHLPQLELGRLELLFYTHFVYVISRIKK